MIKITVLNDDRRKNERCLVSHGLSLLVEKDNFRFLFDVGQDDNFVNNAKELGESIYNVDCIVLSHGHYDHSLGLRFIEKGTRLICHPDCAMWRKSKTRNVYNGSPYSKQELEERFDVTFSRQPYKITDNIIFLGQIERKNTFECKSFPSTLEDGSDDIAIDDSAVVIKTEEGIVVISGCGHSGICNSIEQAKKVSNDKRVLAVVGGFHLKELDEQTQKTVQYFQENDIKNIYLGHCNSDKVCEYFKEKLSEASNVCTFGSGLEIDI